MALVIFLRGVNVGGHNTFRPTLLAEQLKHLDIINIGAAGTFVIRKSISETKLRAELKRILPFDAEIIMCRSKQILQLLAEHPYGHQKKRAGIVRFVSILSRRPHREPPMPLSFPPTGKWLMKILTRKGRFVFGMYRRDMKVIRYLGKTDRLFDVPVTTRNWNTINAIAGLVSAPGPKKHQKHDTPRIKRTNKKSS